MNRSSLFAFTERRRLAAAATVCLTLSLAGCATHSISNGTATVTPYLGTISGSVHGGLQPISGATIQLYATGAGGYSSLATPLLTSAVTTSTAGAFSITGKYTCPTGSYVYLTASGGDAGAGTNNNIALMMALGPCAQLILSPTKNVILNEVTTVAAVYALAQFSTGTTFGATLVSQPGDGSATAPADNFATSATNVQGMANAMAIANVLANNSTGSSPGNNLNGTANVENYTVNTIADILSTCVNSAGGTAANTNCGKLFAATTPVGGSAPVDTIQAALEFALHPGDANLLAGTPSGSTLDALITPQPPYLPYVNTSVAGNTINDWTIAVSYVPVVPNSTTTLLANSNQVAIDGFGNAWISNTGNNSVVELTPNGDPIQAGTVAGQYSINSYNVSNTVTPIAGGSTSTGINFAVALDNANNAFSVDTNGGYIFEVGASRASFSTTGENTTNTNGGGGLPATSLFTGAASSKPTSIAFDATDNLFATLYGNGATSPSGGTGCGSYTAGTKNAVTFTKSGGTYAAIPIFGSGAGSNTSNIAIDNANLDVVAGTPIPGAPFFWQIAEASGSGIAHPTGASGQHYSYLFQGLTQNGGVVPQGCNTPASSISSSASGATTKIAQNANGTNTTDLFNNAYAVAFDSANNLWTANQSPTDKNASFLTSFTKFTPTYSSAVLAAGVLSGTFNTYTNGGLLASGFKPFQIALDGSGNVYGSNNSTKPIVVAMTNTGTGLAPATGFTGATYSADGVTAVLRGFSTAAGIAVDGSGNLWVTSGAATPALFGTLTVNSVPPTNVVQIVGAAVPVITPIAAGVKASKIATKP